MSSEEWPRHDNKAWQEVLDRIRELGWPRPDWTSDHPTLVMDCPESAPQCRLRAYSTGKGTETVAKQALRKANRCPHRKITDELVRVDEHLTTAARLLDGACTLHRLHDLDQRIEELLTLASASMDDAEHALLDREFDGVTAEQDELRRADPPPPEGAHPEDLLESASTPLRRARLELRDLPRRSEDVEARRERLEALTARRDALRDALHRTP